MSNIKISEFLLPGQRKPPAFYKYPLYFATCDVIIFHGRAREIILGFLAVELAHYSLYNYSDVML